MAKLLYHYNGSIVAIESKDVVSAFAAAEKQMATGQFQYIQSGISQQMQDDIKQKWPDELVRWVQEKIRRAKEAQEGSVNCVRAALEETLQDEARKRAKQRGGNLSWALKQEFRYYAVDFALSMMLQKAPDPAISSLYSKVKDMTFCVKTSGRPGRLIIPCNDAERADVYIFGIFNEDLKRAWLLGWAGQKHVKAAPSGDQRTDEKNCPWASPSYYMEFAELRPIGVLLKHLRIGEIPEGILMERIPKAGSIPGLSRLPTRDLNKPDAGDDFDDVIFGKPDVATQSQAPQEDREALGF